MLRTLFVLAILVPGFVATLTNRYAALLLYMWFALFRPQEWLWIDITSLRLSMLLGLMVIVPWDWAISKAVPRQVAARLARQAVPNLTHPLSIGALLFFLAACGSYAHAFDPRLAWDWMDYLSRLLLVGMVAVSLLSTEKRFTLALAVAGISIGFHAAKAGVMSATGGGVRFEAGLGGAFADNNGYAMAVVMVLPFLLAAAQNTSHKWARRALFAAIAPCIFTVVSTFSRAGFLALAAGLLTWVVLQPKRFRILAVAAPLVVVTLLVVPMPAGYTDRMKTIQTYDETGEQSALGRLHFWRVALDMVDANPYGVGLRNYDVAYDRYDFSSGRFGRGRSVHSSHFQVLAEVGYAGAAIYAGMFFWAFVVAFRVRAGASDPRVSEGTRHFLVTMANGLIVSMVGFLVGGAFIALALNDLTWLTFAFVAALDRLSAAQVAEVNVPADPVPFRPRAARRARLAVEAAPLATRTS